MKDSGCSGGQGKGGGPGSSETLSLSLHGLHRDLSCLGNGKLHSGGTKVCHPMLPSSHALPQQQTPCVLGPPPYSEPGLFFKNVFGHNLRHAGP